MNKVTIEQLKKAIRDNAEHFSISTWFTVEFDNDTDAANSLNAEDLNKCGTTACIAGFACILAGTSLGFDPVMGYVAVEADSTKYPISQAAMHVLGWDKNDHYRYSHPLFNLSRWPEHLAAAYASNVTRAGRAEIACAAIDHFARLEEQAPNE
jgi:hypothetical protein